VPDISFDVDMNDDAAVEKSTRDALAGQ
jgi:hypothetical protein